MGFFQNGVRETPVFAGVGNLGLLHRVPGGINEGFIYIYSSFCVGLYCINPLLLVKKFNKPSFIDDDIGSYKKFYNFCKSIIDYLNL